MRWRMPEGDGIENLSGSSAGILIKTSETGGKPGESKALAGMLGSSEFKAERKS